MTPPNDGMARGSASSSAPASHQLVSTESLATRARSISSPRLRHEVQVARRARPLRVVAAVLSGWVWNPRSLAQRDGREGARFREERRRTVLVVAAAAMGGLVGGLGEELRVGIGRKENA